MLIHCRQQWIRRANLLRRVSYVAGFQIVKERREKMADNLVSRLREVMEDDGLWGSLRTSDPCSNYSVNFGDFSDVVDLTTESNADPNGSKADTLYVLRSWKKSKSEKPATSLVSTSDVDVLPEFDPVENFEVTLAEEAILKWNVPTGPWLVKVKDRLAKEDAGNKKKRKIVAKTKMLNSRFFVFQQHLKQFNLEPVSLDSERSSPKNGVVVVTKYFGLNHDNLSMVTIQGCLKDKDGIRLAPGTPLGIGRVLDKSPLELGCHLNMDSLSCSLTLYDGNAKIKPGKYRNVQVEIKKQFNKYKKNCLQENHAIKISSTVEGLLVKTQRTVCRPKMALVLQNSAKTTIALKTGIGIYIDIWITLSMSFDLTIFQERLCFKRDVCNSIRNSWRRWHLVANYVNYVMPSCNAVKRNRNLPNKLPKL